MKFKVYLLIFTLLVFSRSARAMVSPHPIQLYEKGQKLIQQYKGDVGTFVAAQDIFMELIEKYHDSPFGYLGMSQIYRIDAYLGEENYDVKLIRERALPFALKALKLGPSIRAVHENYAFFEKFFEEENSIEIRANPSKN